VSTDATPSSSIEIERQSAPAWGYAAVVSLGGEHDLGTAIELELALSTITGDVLVDLSACTFVDSTILGVILTRFQDLKELGCRLELVAPAHGTSVERIIEIVGVKGLVTVHDGSARSADTPASATDTSEELRA
jgi:anti-anti-sigma factor